MTLSPYRIYGWLPPRPGNGTIWNAAYSTTHDPKEIALYLNTTPPGQRVLILRGLGQVDIDPKGNKWGRGFYIPMTHPDELLSLPDDSTPYIGTEWVQGIVGVRLRATAQLQAIKAAGAKSIDLLAFDQEIDLTTMLSAKGRKAIEAASQTLPPEGIWPAAVAAWNASIGGALAATFPRAQWTNFAYAVRPAKPIPSFVQSPCHYGEVKELYDLWLQVEEAIANLKANPNNPCIPWLGRWVDGKGCSVPWFGELLWHIMLTYGTSRVFNFSPDSDPIEDEVWGDAIAELHTAAQGRDLAPIIRTPIDCSSGAIASAARAGRRVVGRVTFAPDTDEAAVGIGGRAIVVRRGVGLGNWFAVTMRVA